MTDSLCVCIVEDRADEVVPIQIGLRCAGIESRAFTTAEDFLNSGPQEDVGCLVIDVGLPRMSGLDLQSELRQRNYRVPTIVVSGNAAVGDVIRAFEIGACHFYEKPFKVEQLLKVIQSLLESERKRRQLVNECNERLGALSPREREVLDQLIAGTSVKSIGRNLGISPSTAEKHRANVLLKTGFDNVIELTRFLLSASQRNPAIENFSIRRFDRPVAAPLHSILPNAHVPAGRAF